MSFEETLKFYGVTVTPTFYSISARFEVDPRVLFLTCMYVARNSPVEFKTLRQRIWAKVWTTVRSAKEVTKAIEAGLQADLLSFDEEGKIIPGPKLSACIL